MDFINKDSREKPLDPSKHVNYTYGMVLGVDDFKQEFTYLAGRDQLLARGLLGYGTVCGLKVDLQIDSIVDEQNNLQEVAQVVVTAGTALTPRGQIVRVTADQCASLNDWLSQHQSELAQPIGSPVEPLELYVVLSYQACPTDPLPIPGEPCRSEDNVTAPSRLKDDFRLELTFEKPEQTEIEALHIFVALLKQLTISEEATSFANKEDFLEALKESFNDALQNSFDMGVGWAFPLSSPMESPPSTFGSPPDNLNLNEMEADIYLRAAFRLWVTELRSTSLGEGQNCAGQPPNEDKVLLAELGLPIVSIGNDWQIDSSVDIEINEEERPFLTHLQLLQEYLVSRPEKRNFTSQLPNTQGYGVVAAGIVRPSQATPQPQPIQPIHNGLEIDVIGEGLLLVRFDGYTPPRGNHIYIPKVLPTVRNFQLTNLDTSVADLEDLVEGILNLDPEDLDMTISLISFNDMGILLSAMVSDNPANENLLNSASFAIEISQFPFPLANPV